MFREANGAEIWVATNQIVKWKSDWLTTWDNLTLFIHLCIKRALKRYEICKRMNFVQNNIYNLYA